jgi:hypothetical protein
VQGLADGKGGRSSDSKLLKKYLKNNLGCLDGQHLRVQRFSKNGFEKEI